MAEDITDSEIKEEETLDDRSGNLTDWVKEPTVLDLKSELDLASPTQNEQISKIDQWNDLLHIRGKAKPKKISGRSSVQPKLIRKQAEWRYSALTEPFLGHNKIFKVSPVTFEDAEGAKQNELVLNWQFRTKLNRVNFIDDLVRTVVDDGTAICKIGWDRQTTVIKETVPVFAYYAVTDEQQLEALQQAIEAKAENYRMFDQEAPEELKAAVEYYEESGQAVFAVIEGEEEVDVEKIIENKPTVVIHEPRNVYIDPTCNGDIDKALFMVVSFETNQAELKKNPDKYKNLDKINWESNSPLATENHSTSTPQEFKFADKSKNKVVAYEYWGYSDINDDGLLEPIVATWIGDVMIRMEISPYPDKKLPFVLIKYNPVKRELYGEPDAELLEDNQAIAGAVTRGMIDLLGRSANAQQGFAKGFLDPLNRRRFDKGEDYEFNPQNNPLHSVIEGKYPEIPQSALVMLNLQNQEAESLTGVKSFSGGVSGDAFGKVAAGIRGMLDAASKREMAILRRIAKGVTEIGSKIISMNSEFLSEKEVIRVTNTEFVEILREDLKGNFDLEVDISTAEVDEAKSQDLGFLLQTVGPNTDIGIVLMILSEIAELKRMPELAEKIRKFQPQPSPQEQEMMELELEAKRKEVEKLQSEIDLNNAQAEKARSEAFQKVADTESDISGVKHARNMETAKAQSEGNQNLQVTKALTTPTKQGEIAPDIDAAIGFNLLTDQLNGSKSMPIDTLQRDELAQQDPSLSINSSQFDPSQDPALNPNINI